MAHVGRGVPLGHLDADPSHQDEGIDQLAPQRAVPLDYLDALDRGGLVTTEAHQVAAPVGESWIPAVAKRNVHKHHSHIKSSEEEWGQI